MRRKTEGMCAGAGAGVGTGAGVVEEDALLARLLTLPLLLLPAIRLSDVVLGPPRRALWLLAGLPMRTGGGMIGIEDLTLLDEAGRAGWGLLRALAVAVTLLVLLSLPFLSGSGGGGVAVLGMPASTLLPVLALPGAPLLR